MSVVGKMVCAAVVVAMCTLHETSGHTQSTTQPLSAVAALPLQTSKNLAFIEAPEVRVGDLTQAFPRGSQLVRIHLDAAGVAQGQPLSLTPGMFAAANPQVSFDGRRLLFSAKQAPAGTWQIYETPSAGGPIQQITHCATDCVQPEYLPENQITYAIVEGVGVDRSSEVQVSENDGTYAHPITFGPGRFEVETVLRSGRLLLSADTPLIRANRAGQPRALYVINPDGSGLALFRQSDAERVIRSSAKELADGTVVFVQQDAARGLTSHIAWIRPGTLHATKIAATQSDYASVQAMDAETLVASRRIGQQFDLFSLPLTGPDRARLLYQGLHTSSIQAVPIAPHPSAQVYHSTLSTERTSGRIICLDAYASKDVASGHLPGHVARLRVLTKAQTGEKILGEAPVELDGSFYAKVPADRPIRFMLLGSKGEILRQQHSWTWVRPGEDRGCFGCHESQAQAPQNRSPMTLLRMDTPTSLLENATPTTAPQKAARP